MFEESCYGNAFNQKHNEGRVRWNRNILHDNSRIRQAPWGFRVHPNGGRRRSRLATVRADPVAPDDKRGEAAVYYVSLVSHYPRNFSAILRRNRTTRRSPGRRNPWMQSNQRPFARGIIAGRAYYAPLYARPTENLQNAFLNECEIVRRARRRAILRGKFRGRLAFVVARLVSRV